MTPLVRDLILFSAWSPYGLPNLAARYDRSILGSLVFDGSNRLQLLGDISGQSPANGLVLNGVAANYASFPALTAPGTGDFTYVARFSPASLAATVTLIDGSNNSAAIVLIGGKIWAVKNSIGLVSAGSNTALSLYTQYTLAYVRSGTTGTYYLNGAADGTCTDSFNYSVGVTNVGASGVAGGFNPANGIFSSARVYTRALSAGEVAADAAGTVQTGCLLDIDFTAQAKLAATFASGTRGGATSVTVTVNTTGDSGAHIAGARDRVQMNAARQSVLSTGAGGNYSTYDGSNDYDKSPPFSLSQPATVFVVGAPLSFTDGDTVFDGNDLNSMRLFQQTTNPNTRIYAGGGGGVCEITTWVIGSRAVMCSVFNGASSLCGMNRNAAVAGNPGSSAGNGFTFGAFGDASGGFWNGAACEELIFSGALDAVARDRTAAFLMKKWSIS